jgi:hypothetical protein
LESLAKAQGSLNLNSLTRGESPLPRLSGSGTDTSEANAPYVVWLDNQSGANLEARLHWGQRNVSGVQQTGGVVYTGQVAPFRLGGPDGCAVVYAYVLQIYYQGQLLDSTGVVQPSDDDGAACSDAYGVG